MPDVCESIVAAVQAKEVVCLQTLQKLADATQQGFFELWTLLVDELPNEQLSFDETKFVIEAILFLCHENLFLTSKSGATSSTIFEVCTDALVTLPAKIANQASGGLLTIDALKRLCFWKIVQVADACSSHFKDFDDRQVLRSLRRLFLLREWSFFAELLGERKFVLLRAMLRDLRPAERKVFAVGLSAQSVPIAAIAEVFSEHLGDTGLLFGLLFADPERLGKFAACRLFVQQLVGRRNDGYENGGDVCALVNAAIATHWAHSRFCDGLFGARHAALCALLCVAFDALPDKRLNAKTLQLFSDGVFNHLASACRQTRIIGMCVAQRVIPQQSPAQKLDFELDAADPLVRKWTLLVDDDDDASDLSRLLLTAADTASTPSKSAAAAAALPSIDRLTAELRAMKIKPPLFVADAIRLLYEKKNALSVECGLLALPELLRTLSKTEIRDFGDDMLQTVAFLRNSFDIEGFDAMKTTVLVQLFVLKPATCAFFVTGEIFERRMSDGEKSMLLDCMLQTKDALLNALNTEMTLNDADKKSKPLCLVSSKVKYMSFTAIQQIHTSSQRVQPSTANVSAYASFVSLGFFSLLRRFFSTADSRGFSVSLLQFQQHTQELSIKVASVIAFFLLAAEHNPDLPQMLQEMLPVVAVLRFWLSDTDAVLRLNLLLCYAFLAVIPVHLVREPIFMITCSRLMEQIDAFLTAVRDEVGIARQTKADYRQWAIGCLEALASKLQ